MWGGLLCLDVLLAEALLLLLAGELLREVGLALLERVQLDLRLPPRLAVGQSRSAENEKERCATAARRCALPPYLVSAAAPDGWREGGRRGGDREGSPLPDTQVSMRKFFGSKG